MSLDVSYAMTIGRLPARAVRVLRLSGREAISELYRFEIVVASSLPEVLLRRVALGQRARLAMRVAGESRVIHGIVARIRQDATQLEGRGGAHDVHRYHLTLVPRAWLLGRRKGSHIFQNKRVDEVIDEVAKRLHVSTRWELNKPFPARPYCTQFEETDWALLRRLCAENGVWFRFEQASAIDELIGTALAAAENALPPLPFGELGGLLPSLPTSDHDETIVLSNHGSYAPLHSMGVPVPEMLPTLHYQDASGALTGHHEACITEAALTEAITSTGAIYREYDPLRPLADMESHSGGAVSAEGMMDAIGSGVQAGISAVASGDAEALVDGALDALDDLGIEGPLGANIDDLDVYEHDGNDLFPDWDQKKTEPELILAQHRRRRKLLEGASHAVRVESGRSFKLAGHPLAAANQDYAVVEVHHEGVATFQATGDAQPYVNRFTCVPRDVIYVPERPPRRSVQVSLTARVVGPEGEEIHVNERGEIKVKFHWDRRDDEHDTTCWIRTMHPWAGVGWGFQFIPRVGMEAVVVFEGGDPDMPLVTGCVYNGVLPPPFKLPGHKTQSGIRTRSTPGSTGHNELMFEDAVDNELVFLRAEKDQHNLVQHDRLAQINHKDRTEVADDQQLLVGGQQHISVQRDRNVELHASDAIHVFGKRHLQVDEVLEEQLGSHSIQIAGNERRVIRGSSQTMVDGSLVALSKGSATLQVGQVEAPKNATLHVEGRAQMSAMQSIDLSADENITLRVGQSFIRITEDSIQLSSSSVTLGGGDAQVRTADGTVSLQGDTSIQGVSDSIIMQASGAALALQSDAALDGSRVLLNSPGQASDEIETSEPNPLKLEVTDQNGDPLAYQRFIIALDGGGEHMGYLDENGKAEVEIDGPGRVSFPDLAEVEEA